MTNPLAPAAVIADRSARVRVRVSGPDAAKFLHNLTTQEVKRFPAGEGREAFVTSPQGKTMAYVSLLAGQGYIDVRSDKEGFGEVLRHLHKYGVFDDVEIVDESASTFEWHLAGPSCGHLFQNGGATLPPDGELRHCETTFGHARVRIIRETVIGPCGLTLIGRCDDLPAALDLRQKLAAVHGLVVLSESAFEVARVEAGTPASGRDVTPDNLPQEVGRDALTINFVKGCYLGQETVARLDALGHVNKLLRGLIIDAQRVPLAGSVLQADGKTVGKVTSAAWSPARGQVVALGYVRTSHTAPGSSVVVKSGDEEFPAVVTDLPMA